MKTQTVKPDDLVVKSLTALISDVGNLYLVNAFDTQKDSAYVARRIEAEGISFVTKTLPSFGKHFDRCLRDEVFTPFPSFKKDRRGALPLFLRGLTCLVFATDGTLLDTPDANAIREIRQVCFMYYKFGGEYPKELVDECIKDFVETDETLTCCSDLRPEKYGYIYQAQKIIARLFKRFDPREINPRPGPGQCSTRTAMEDRFEPHVLYKKVHEAYPYYRYYFCNTDHLRDSVRNYKSLDRSSVYSSRLTVVPKDSRGPRIICMEPPEFMWFQQGLRRLLYDHIERHPLTRGHVNFRDQTVNGDLALKSSADGRFATLDMKEASDRISLDLVDELFHEVPELRDRLLALSTDYITLPDGTRFRKKKFAPMGSALCFPIMSIVHFALACSIIMIEQGVSMHDASRKIYVYGDDLLIAADAVPFILEGFPLYDLKFNVDKSFFRGQFRESCGVDAFNGVNVTPVRVKTHGLSTRAPGSIATAFAHFHAFFNRGYWKLARVLQESIGTMGDFPCVSKDSGIPGWIVPKSDLLLANKLRWKFDDNLQCVTLRARTISAKPDRWLIGGWEQLMRQQLVAVEGESSALVERHREKFSWRRIPLSSL